LAEVLAVNLTEAFLVDLAQIPAMLERGAGELVFTGSFDVNRVCLHGMGAYSAPKAVLMFLVRGITADYCSAGVFSAKYSGLSAFASAAAGSLCASDMQADLPYA
jgi:NAD(P)-dependent dehydrogenase (short-subunit alcohol dehydrogenase family)